MTTVDPSEPASRPAPPLLLKQWLERIDELDVRNLQAEWTRIASSALCRELAWTLAQESAAPLEALRHTLMQERMRKLFNQFFRPTLDEQRRLTREQIARNSISGEATYNRLCGMVAGALAVRAAADPLETDLPLQIDTTVRAWHGISSPLTPAAPVSPPPTNPELRLDAALAAWRADNPSVLLSEGGAVRNWLHALWSAASDYLLPHRAEKTTAYHVVSHRETWLLNYRSDGKAFLGRLHVEALQDGEGCLYARPERMGLVSMSAEFQETIRTAWNLALQLSDGDAPLRSGLEDYDFRWWLEGYAALTQGEPALQGSSHGAATAIAFTQLLTDEPIDLEFVVTGAIDSEGTLFPVGFVKEKSEAALSRLDSHNKHLITRLCVSKANYAQACEGADLIGRDPTSCVLPVEKVADLLPYASGLLEQMRRLCLQECRTILSQASQRLQRPLTCWEEYRDLYIPLQVEISRRLAAAGEENPVTQTLKLPWQKVRDTLQRAFILADSGLGKTALFWYEVTAHCTSALEHLAQTNARSDEARFAFLLSPKSLPLSLPLEGADGLMSLFVTGILSRIEIREALYPHVYRQISRMIAEGRCALYLDALDEATIEAQVHLHMGLEDFIRSYPNARLLLSLRPAALSENRQLQQDWDHVSLLPFRAEQIRQSVFAWFQLRPDYAQNLWNRIEKNPRHLQILQTPLMLWIACTIAPSARQPGALAWRRRSDLLELFIDDAISKWTRRAPIPSAFQQSAFRTFLTEIALTLLLQRRQGDLWPQETVQIRIQAVLKAYPVLRERNVLQDMLHLGILTLLPLETQEQGLTFSHMAIGDYLAGVCLARRVNTGRWAECEEILNSLAGETSWQEPLVFASVYLDNPVPLLELLCNPSFDDETRRRLTLAAYCLAEISSGS